MSIRIHKNRRQLIGSKRVGRIPGRRLGVKARIVQKPMGPAHPRFGARQFRSYPHGLELTADNQQPHRHVPPVFVYAQQIVTRKETQGWHGSMNSGKVWAFCPHPLRSICSSKRAGRNYKFILEMLKVCAT